MTVDQFAHSPSRIAPSVSKIVPRMHACRRVSTPDPTDVAKEFATSLAPKAQARMNDMTNAVATIQIYSGGISESAMRAQRWLSGLPSQTVLSANQILDR